MYRIRTDTNLYILLKLSFILLILSKDFFKLLPLSSF
jgi:hypothetical protein